MDVYDPREEAELVERLQQLREFKRRSSRARAVDEPEPSEGPELPGELVPAALGALLARPEILEGLPDALRGAELGRMLLSGAGAALGSRHQAIGAGAGAAVGSLLFDWAVKKGLIR